MPLLLQVSGFLQSSSVGSPHGVPEAASFGWHAPTASHVSGAVQSSLVALNWWLGLRCGIDIAFQAWLFAWPMAKISALLPVTQGGIGVREAALAALLAPFGVPAVLAVAAGLVFQGVIISGGLIGGALSYLLGWTSPGQKDQVGGKAVGDLVGSRLSVVSEHDEVDLVIPLLAAN